MTCDVLVAGGGSAGLAAAIAASCSGAKTLLVEHHGMLGGMATSALVHSICGLYQSDGRIANPGFGSFFANRLIQSGGAYGPVKMGRCRVLPHHPVSFALLADELAGKSNAAIRLHTDIVSADIKAGSVELWCRGERLIVQARTMIDATGDATLAHLGGIPVEMESRARLQRPAYVFAVDGILDGAVDDTGRLRWANQIARAVNAGLLPEAALAATIHGSGRQGMALITLNLDGGPDYSPLDPEYLTRLEQDGRQLASALIYFLRSSSPDFQNVRISALPARAGIRESRRLIGRQRVELADFEDGREFPDAIAKTSWPIERREVATEMRLQFPKNEVFCGIPLGALRARDHDNFFAAGRCISCSHDVQASIRVIGSCFATGEAAGIAAALVADGAEPTATSILTARQRLLEREYRR